MQNQFLKRTLSLVVAVAILAAYIPMPAFAALVEKEGNLYVDMLDGVYTKGQLYQDLAEKWGEPGSGILFKGYYYKNKWTNITSATDSGSAGLNDNESYKVWRTDVSSWGAKQTEVGSFTARTYYNVTVDVVGSEGGAVIYDGKTYGDGEVIKYYPSKDLAIAAVSLGEAYTVVLKTEKPTASGTLTVTYTEKENAIKVNTVITGNGAVTVNNSENESVDVIKGNNATIVATPGTGCYVESIVVNNSDVTSSASFNNTVATYTIEEIAEDTEVVVVFSEASITPNDNEVVVDKFDIIDSQWTEVETDIETGFDHAEGIELEYEYLAGTIVLEDWNVNREIWLGLEDAVPTSDEIAQSIHANLGILGSLVDVNTIKNLLGDIDEIFHSFGYNTPDENGNVFETVRASFVGNNEIPAAVSGSRTVNIVDGRTEVDVDINSEITVKFGSYADDAELIEKLLEGKNGVTADDKQLGEEYNAKLKFNYELVGKDVGTYTVEVYMDDSADHEYKDVNNVRATINIEKANVALDVESLKIRYQEMNEGDVNVSDLITVTPDVVIKDEPDTFEFAVGFMLGDEVSRDAGVITYVNIPDMIDIPGLDLNSILKFLGLDEGATLNIAQLKDALEFTKRLAGDSDKIDESAIDAIISTLESIEGLEGIGQLKIKLSIDSNLVVKDSGVYITGGVVSDKNYNTAINVGYLVITPDGRKAELAFAEQDDNGIITLPKAATFDFGTVVTKVYEGDIEAAQAHVQNIFITLNEEGTPIFSNTESHEVGAYIQIGYIQDLGNVMYYAVPVVRAYAIVTNPVTVHFIDENGDVNHDRVFTFDGTPKSMTAKAYSIYGNEMPSDNGEMTYKYVGIESDGEAYNSSEAPVHAGTYTVTATYKPDDQSSFGVGVGAMIIKPAQAEVSVEDKVVTYDEQNPQPVDVMTMIEKSPEDAKIAVIMAGLNVKGDFSENGTAALEGLINIDFPARVDKVLEKIWPSAYGNGITKGSFVNKINQYTDILEKIGFSEEQLTELKSFIDSLPEDIYLTFKEQSEVNPTNVGAYLVGAMVFDSDYVGNIDTGVLVIAPSITEAELKWNIIDENSIITRAAIEAGYDIGATAFDKQGNVSELNDKLAYYFVCVDKNGEVHTVTDIEDVTELPNGVVRQIAYIPGAYQADANFIAAAPIMRTFILAPQTAVIEFIDENGDVNHDRLFVYDENPHGMDVKVYDQNKTNELDTTNGTLTVTYIGIEGDAEGYKSTTPPTEAGVYTVVATYVEGDENGSTKYFGMTVGAMAIKPADSAFLVGDDEVEYDGNEHMVEIENPNDLTYILIVDDNNGNVNVILPEEWNVDNATVDIDAGVADATEALHIAIEKIEGVNCKIDLSIAENKITEMLEKIGDDCDTFEINGDKPIEIGVYDITGIAFGNSNYDVAVDKGVLEIIGHSFTDYVSNNDATCTEDGTKTAECDNGCGAKDTITDEGSALNHSEPDTWTMNDEEHWKICDREGCATEIEGTRGAHVYETDNKCICGKEKPDSGDDDNQGGNDDNPGGGSGTGGSGAGGGITIPDADVPLLNRDDHFAFLYGYTDGTFGPERNMTRVEAVVMFSRLMEEKMEEGKTYPCSFSDVPADAWYANAVGYMEQFGIIKGYPDGTFGPYDEITRAQFATIAARFDNLTSGDSVFTDVPAGHWAADYINFAASKGWVTGYTDGTFRPDEFITRSEVTAFVCRILDRMADADYIAEHKDELERTFTDVKESDWSYLYIMEATNGHDYEKFDEETWVAIHE